MQKFIEEERNPECFRCRLAVEVPKDKPLLSYPATEKCYLQNVYTTVKSEDYNGYDVYEGHHYDIFELHCSIPKHGIHGSTLVPVVGTTNDNIRKDKSRGCFILKSLSIRKILMQYYADKLTTWFLSIFMEFSTA